MDQLQTFVGLLIKVRLEMCKLEKINRHHLMESSCKVSRSQNFDQDLIAECVYALYPY